MFREPTVEELAMGDPRTDPCSAATDGGPHQWRRISPFTINRVEEGLLGAGATHLCNKCRATACFPKEADPQ